MKVLIDGDGLIYRCGFACEKSKYLVTGLGDYPEYFDTAKEARARAEDKSGTHIWSRKELEPLENALQLVKGAMSDCLDRYRNGDRDSAGYSVYLSPSVGNFRDKIATVAKYKGNRDYVARPTYHREITDYLVRVWGAVVAEGQEADDALGIALGPDVVCVSFDKDLLQVPGLHYNWVTKEEHRIGPREGALRFWAQVISGDTTDNVPGCRGVGPVGAEKAVATVNSDAEAWKVVLTLYEKEYGPQEGRRRAIETARLVRIRRKAGEIWSPPDENMLDVQRPGNVA